MRLPILSIYFLFLYVRFLLVTNLDMLQPVSRFKICEPMNVVNRRKTDVFEFPEATKKGTNRKPPVRLII